MTRHTSRSRGGGGAGRGRGRGSLPTVPGSDDFPALEPPAASTGPSGSTGAARGTRGRGTGPAPWSGARPRVSGPGPPAELGPLSAVMQRMTVGTTAATGTLKAFAPRPNKGTAGEKIALLANFFSLKLPSNLVVFKYDISISRPGERLEAKLNRTESLEIFWSAVREHGLNRLDIVYDGKKLAFSLSKYSECILEVKHPQPIEGQRTMRPREYLVRFGLHNEPVRVDDCIHFAPDINMFETERLQLQFIELLMRQTRREMPDDFTECGRCFYSAVDKMDLGGGRAIYKGFYSGSRIIDGWEMTLNLDITASVFLEQISLLDFISFALPSLRPDRLTNDQYAIIHKKLKGLNLKATHINHSFKCFGLCSRNFRNLTAASHTFDWIEDGEPRGTISTQNYFKQKYNITLRYPHWPLVQRGKDEKARFFPIEVCAIAKNNRVRNKNMEAIEQQKMIKYSAVPPEQRLRDIQSMLQKAQFASDARLKNFGVSVSLEMKNLTGRVLEPPKIGYKMRGRIEAQRASKGEWRMDTHKVLCQGATLNDCWVIIKLEHPNDRRNLDYNVLIDFIKALMDQANRMGMQMRLPCEDVIKLNIKRGSYYDQDDRNQLENCFREQHENYGDRLQMIMVIMPEKNGIVYADVKNFGDKLCDVPTQCLQASVVQQDERKRRQTLENITLKLNAKLGGINQQVAELDDLAKKYIENGGVLFVGADVSHPEPGDKSAPSLAAICGNIDNLPYKYIGVEQVQAHRDEMIRKLSAAIEELLLAYYKNTRLKPGTIIYYRDGVSDGWFSQVLEYELCEIRRACKKVSPDYKPKVTFVVVQKRHKTRLFRRDMDLNARSVAQRNIPAGTVVDDSITHPVEFDFYLCSHIGIQGTSRPTHYHVLWDENNFKADDIQSLTYRLCYAYARCTRSVSIPVCTYYAHWISNRARLRLNSSLSNQDAASSDGSEPAAESEQRLLQLQEIIKIGNNVKEKMYWQ